jgi:hypothetical protein
MRLQGLLWQMLCRGVFDRKHAANLSPLGIWNGATATKVEECHDLLNDSDLDRKSGMSDLEGFAPSSEDEDDDILPDSDPRLGG